MPTTAAPLRLSTAQPDFETRLSARLHWSADQDEAIEQRVKAILADVRARGDAAVLEYTARFDGLQAASMAELELKQSDFKAAFDSLPAEQQQALQEAAARVRRYHEWQKKQGGETATYRDDDGTLLGQKVTPLDRVGIYVPGGKAAYPSSLIMNAVPAHVAGVGEIIMVVPTPVRGSIATGGSDSKQPPALDGQAPAAIDSGVAGERNPLVLAAAHVAGVTRAFTIGGAQAVAALAYGTATIPKVDKITGPGNAFVAAAKRRVFGKVGIDMKIQLWDATVAWGKLATQEFDAFLMSYPYVTATEAMSLYFRSQQAPTPNRMNWKDPKTDELLKSAATAVDADKRKQAIGAGVAVVDEPLRACDEVFPAQMLAVLHGGAMPWIA